jgi:hypothetical protein
MTEINERLQELLDQKDKELEEAQTEMAQLTRELAGTLDGWRRETEIQDDGKLPVPRLELVYTPSEGRGWMDYKVLYRLVRRHFLGDLLSTPLGMTSVHGGMGTPPTDLPFRDGAHILYDAAHLKFPAFKIMPNCEPIDILKTHAGNRALEEGNKHRRE